MNDLWSVVSEKEIFSELSKNTHNDIKNRGGTPILINLVRVHPINIQIKYLANPFFRDVKYVNKRN